MMRPMENRRRGFSVVELMVTVTIVAILAAVAVPSFVGMVNTNRLAAQSNELLSAIQYARTEAVRTNSRVTFCGVDSDTASSDADCDDGEQPFWAVIGPAAGGGQEQLRLFSVREPLKVSSELDMITFTPDGMARDPVTRQLIAGDITVCVETNNPPQNKRVVSIASGSRVVISKPDEDGEGSCE